MPEKEWIKPQLIVLVRGKPEERVLVSCKGSFPIFGIGYPWTCFNAYPYNSCDVVGST